MAKRVATIEARGDGPVLPVGAGLAPRRHPGRRAGQRVQRLGRPGPAPGPEHPGRRTRRRGVRVRLRRASGQEPAHRLASPQDPERRRPRPRRPARQVGVVLPRSRAPRRPADGPPARQVGDVVAPHQPVRSAAVWRAADVVDISQWCTHLTSSRARRHRRGRQPSRRDRADADDGGTQRLRPPGAHARPWPGGWRHCTRVAGSSCCGDSRCDELSPEATELAYVGLGLQVAAGITEISVMTPPFVRVHFHEHRRFGRLVQVNSHDET